MIFGSFITPVNTAPHEVVALTQASERAGLDLATFQDHPYHAGFLDTWTLLSYAAARPERIRLAGNVLDLPLRPSGPCWPAPRRAWYGHPESTDRPVSS